MLTFLWRVFEHKDQIAQAFATFVASGIALCAIISTILPPPTEPGLYATLCSAINKIGQNYGHARNASDVQVAPRPAAHAPATRDDHKPPAPFI